MIVGKGAADHAARLQRLSSRALINNIGRALLTTAENIRNETAASLDEGTIFGPGHIPSVAPNPPNSDTRALAESGKFGPLVEVSDYLQTTTYFGGPSANYAAAQELGFGNLPERAYLRPATERARKPHANRLREAVTKTALGK